MDDIMAHKDKQIWLPPHVLQDPLFDHSNKYQNFTKIQHCRIGEFRQPAVAPLREIFPSNYNTRQKQQSTWRGSKGENHMQAFFLVSPGRTASGTGVFLPATAFHPSTKKPARSPVLLPARGVQSLNLNVHNNSIHITPRPETGENDLEKKKSEKVATPMNNEVETLIDSMEKLLPEEWTY